MRFTLAGYFPKITACPAGFNAPAHVEEVCSVSGCVNTNPENWVDQWLHNELWFFDSPAVARTAAAGDERFEILAFRILHARFVDGRREDWTPEPVTPEPLADGYQSLGFDAVSRSAGPMFECSPLSCNYMHREIEVNRHCLVDSPVHAIAMAERFSREKPEPGDYYVFEVFRLPLAAETHHA